MKQMRTHEASDYEKYVALSPLDRCKERLDAAYRLAKVRELDVIMPGKESADLMADLEANAEKADLLAETTLAVMPTPPKQQSQNAGEETLEPNARLLRAIRRVCAQEQSFEVTATDQIHKKSMKVGPATDVNVRTQSNTLGAISSVGCVWNMLYSGVEVSQHASDSEPKTRMTKRRAISKTRTTSRDLNA